MRRIVIGLLLTIAVRGHGVVAASRDKADESATYTVECTFSNPSYSGHCGVSEVTPRSDSPRSACERILTCLNDAQCSTKTYCNATTIRGGWKLESAKEQTKE
jgi:hypothetical protein